MDWVLRIPQVYSTFGSLGYVQADGYHVNENCNAALESILQSVLTEDEYLRPYRRSIHFAKNIEKGLIPLLVNAKEVKTLELLIRILVNLTIPIECLLSINVASEQVKYEVNNFLTATKAALTDIKATTALVDFIKINQDREKGGKLSAEQCANISNSLMLLRNILHIPEESYSGGCSPDTKYTSTPHYSMQNQIMWNIFSQGIDVVLIDLMIIPEACNWAVTMVQLVALLYKDQHVSTLHQLLNTWLDVSVSDSTDDNESNTSSPQRVSENSSLMITSDSSNSNPCKFDEGNDGTGQDNNGRDDSNNVEVSKNYRQLKSEPENDRKTASQKRDDTQRDSANTDSANKTSIEYNEGQSDGRGGKQSDDKNKKQTAVSQNSDFGYGTQIDTRGESISTSSNDDEYPFTKPVHAKPVHPKQKPNKNRPDVTIHDKKWKKLVKTGKSNIYAFTAQELQCKTPSDENISIILKEFTVDFLLKGYNSLVETLYNRILLNTTIEFDTSHFFWLVTYFLKFAAQIELDLEHISSVLSFEIVSYLTAEGVNLCEQCELAIKLDQNGLKSVQRKLHLVVTAIREFIHTLEAYEKIPHTCKKSKDFLMNLANKMSQTEELRNLLVLLLQYYNKKYHTKQYLEDLIVTNHVLLSFLDRVIKKSDNKKTTMLMVDHMKQFATTEIMLQYGTLLEDYVDNGEFVNDCVLTLMHHVGGELESVASLLQTNILATFNSIWKSKFNICDDWSDLIEYVIHTRIKKPQTLPHIRLQCPDKPTMEMEHFEDFSGAADDKKEKTFDQGRWTEKEISCLSWNYMQFSRSPDVIKQVTEQLKENGICKTKMSVVTELYRQNMIQHEQYSKFAREEKLTKVKKAYNTEEIRDYEIKRLCELLRQDGKSKSLDWLQDVLLEICFAKICFEKKAESLPSSEPAASRSDYKPGQRELFKENINDLPVMSSVAWLALLHNQPVALVPWNCEQSAICKDMKFLQLVYKFGFCMPVDTEKVFIQIPNIWTTKFIFEMAGKLSCVDTTKLKFSVDDLSGTADFASQIFYDSRNIIRTPSLENYPTTARSSPQAATSYSTGLAEPTSWLDIIKKSQNGKLFDGGSEPSALNDVDMGLDMPASAACFVLPDALPVGGLGTYPYDDDADTDCSNSVFDTVSVASELNCMYVSDEDEKPDITE